MSVRFGRECPVCVGRSFGRQNTPVRYRSDDGTLRLLTSRPPDPDPKTRNLLLYCLRHYEYHEICYVLVLTTVVSG